MQPKPVAPAIEAQHTALLASLPLDDTRDFEDADRGFIAQQNLQSSRAGMMCGCRARASAAVVCVPRQWNIGSALC